MKRALPYIFLILSVFFVTIQVKAQYANILISEVDNPNEPSIYINPKNTNHIIAGANINSYYFSYDGGQTWNRNPLTSTLGVWGDPCLLIDTSGISYFFHLSYPDQANWIDRIVCQKSVNGVSWNNGAGIGKNDPKQQDKEWACINPFNNEMYVAWTQFDSYGSTNPDKKSNIMFSRSSDQGETWSTALQINEISGDCVDSDNTTEGAVPAVGPNGEVYVSWAGPAGLVFDRSTDGGNTWLDQDIFVSDIPGGWDFSIPGISRCNGLPVTCCDLGNSPYRGNIYINWSDGRSNPDGSDVDIWLARSTDGGNTWSSPIRVNNDLPGRQQFFTWMTVDQVTGYLWFVFYDRRNYSDSRTDVWMAVSKDGGSSFQNFKISESPFIPNQNVFFGDYTCISAHNNIVRPIWTRLDGEYLSILTAIVDSLITDLANWEKIPFAVEQNYPNPFSESTVFSFRLNIPAVIVLSVYDLLGNKVATLLDNELVQPGKYIKRFDPARYNLPSGVYYFSLAGNGINRQRKIVYQK